MLKLVAAESRANVFFAQISNEGLQGMSKLRAYRRERAWRTMGGKMVPDSFSILVVTK